MRKEFSIVFSSLFKKHYNHEALVRILAKVRKGMTRSDILQKSKLGSGGTLSKTLQELEESGFIERYTPFRGKKDSLYRLADEYSMFYIKFVEGTKTSGTGIWIKEQQAQPYKIWAGFAFETLCLKHIDQIREGLKISGVRSTYSSWVSKHEGAGAQIDLLIDRDDNVINICEMKFYNTAFQINKRYASEVLKKVNAFSEISGTLKSVMVVFFATNGVLSNDYSRQVVQDQLVLKDLFVALK